MDRFPALVQEHLSAGKALFEGGAVREPIFSKGTYQVEVRDQKETYFPFLQVKDSGELNDCFCTCKVSEKGNGCPHLSAAYLRIFNETKEPLHIRFLKSLWNKLFQMASKRHGYSTDCLKKEGENLFCCESKTKKRLFSIETKSAKAKKRFGEIVAERVEETEETSLKFSNLSADEIASWRAGKASHQLQYELSFWSDLAKWLMALEDQKEPYEIVFSGTEEGAPHEITLSFPGLGVWFYVSDVNWPWIIPALATVRSPLQVFDSEDHTIEKIEYDEASRSLIILHRGGVGSGESDFQGFSLGEDWLYVEGKGFYRKRNDPLIASGRIGPDKVAEALRTSQKTLQKFLPIHPEPIKAQYRLKIDAEARLHIELFAFEPGDMQDDRASCFPPWVYLPGKGFYRLDDWMFEEKEKVIERDQVAAFVNKHRLWLHNFPGFQTHLGSLEAHLTYEVKPDGELVFAAKLDYPEQFEETIDFDEWVYIKGQGFYMKKESRGRLPLHPGLTVKADEVKNFIDAHKDDLEQVQSFYSSKCPVEKSGLIISLADQHQISISPKVEYTAEIDPKKVRFFGDYIYEAGKGFSELPPAGRLPERYRQEAVIPPSQEAAFLAYELEPLKPWILEIDPRLKRPGNLQLKIRKIVRDKRRRGQEWLVDLIYESESGLIDIFAIWDGFQDKRRHLFSQAGLLALKEPRFNWIRQLQKKRLDRKKGMIRMNTLEWIRLSVFEDIQVPKGPDAEETQKLLQELGSFETHRILDTSKLKSKLRPYQEIGLQWLWFLYCHGLSGLLCDDMGLGKTHQAMALLAAVAHDDPEKGHKYLVVCPTSVIYHWQELLKKFLPDIRVCTYYGLARTLDNFDTDYDLLLTSYGILRTGRENLKAFQFELAFFDEIQIAKNQNSQTHAALGKINARMRLGLTGTPIENRIRELKSLFDIVLPGYMPPDAVFREMFVQPIEKHRDEEKKGLLAKLVKPFILRRKKSEVLFDLPEKIEEISYCDLSHEQKELYKQVAFKMRDTVYQDLRDSNKPVSYVHVFSALSSLKQICDHPSLVEGDVKNYQNHQSGKWDLFVELINEARDSGQKVVVFSQYLDMLAIIEQHLKKKGIGYASIKGSTRDRSEQLRRFREDPACEVFVASLLAAGVGIDLTVASIVIHYDRWWNPAKENQATDRVHRIGQNRGVQVFKLVTKHTIEEHIHELIERKKGLLEEVIGQDEADQITYLSRDELLAVFEKMFREVE
ncbi:MAG: DEAD/DEAH box helicase [Verrucomicrobia bacterium]|nr:DEAD/DEAH box helicase [Verrucomicrobiota bacterium]